MIVHSSSPTPRLPVAIAAVLVLLGGAHARAATPESRPDPAMVAWASETLERRVQRFAEGWMAWWPGRTAIRMERAATPFPTGLIAYRAVRVTAGGEGDDTLVLLADPACDRVFVGAMLFDPGHDHPDRSPYSDGIDVVSKFIGFPTEILAPEPNGNVEKLVPAIYRVRMANGSADLPGFVVHPRKIYLLGEFHQLDEDIAGFRRWLVGYEMGPARGNGRRVTAFSDFQCPACRTWAGLLDSRIPVVEREVRHLAANREHEWSRVAANLSECLRRVAGDEEFFRFEEAIHGGEASLSLQRILEVAFDRAEFLGAAEALQACREEPSEDQAPSARVLRDFVAAFRLGIRSTPTFVIDGVLIGGRLPVALEYLDLLEAQRGAR